MVHQEILVIPREYARRLNLTRKLVDLSLLLP